MNFSFKSALHSFHLYKSLIHIKIIKRINNLHVSKI